MSAVKQLISKKLVAFVLTLLALVVLAVLHVDGPALENLSLAVMFGLPTLLGGQSVVDFAKSKAAAKDG